jgi:hypothetical protein
MVVGTLRRQRLELRADERVTCKELASMVLVVEAEVASFVGRDVKTRAARVNAVQTVGFAIKRRDVGRQIFD